MTSPPLGSRLVYLSRKVASRAYGRIARAVTPRPFGDWVGTIPGGAPAPGERELRDLAGEVFRRGGVARTDGGALLVASYPAVKAVLGDAATYTSAPFRAVNPDIVGLDGAAHQEVRQTLAASFARARVQARRDWLRSVAWDTLGQMAERGETDLTTGFLDPFRYRAGASVLGFGSVPTDTLLLWGPEHFYTYAAHGATGESEAARAFRGAAREAFARAQRGDAAGAMVEVAAIPQAMASPESFERVMGVLFLASVFAMSGPFKALAQTLVDRPDVEGEIRDDPALRPAFMDEVFRLVGSLTIPREVSREVELEGHRLTPGTLVYCLTWAANRDPDVWEAPDAFRMGRPTRHLLFGYGPHFCIGHHLAREMMGTALDVLLDAWPSAQEAFRPARQLARWRRADGDLRVAVPPRLPV